ncbi:MAG TPA: S-layer protein, partial [Cyanobacteria bacterium UBA11049]|nr:S-layer protein [Cyanobacteria bacterium UBA11049]
KTSIYHLSPTTYYSPASVSPETSVSRLADVQPFDWEFQALRSLSQRYGVAGYSDSKYQGDRAITRDEFAASLNALLLRVNESIATGFTQQISSDDLTSLERLQQEYGAELATLNGRLAPQEARAAELKANQFSTTTKLSGQTIFAFNGGGFAGKRLFDPTARQIASDDPNTTLLYRVALDFNTSFSGKDLLKVRLDTGSNGSTDNAAGVLEPNFGSVLDFSVKPPRNSEFGIGRLYYTFNPVKNVQVSLGTAIVPTEYVDRNRYVSLNYSDFSTQALLNNYILFPINGQSSGAAIAWTPNNTLTVRGIYVAADAANSGDRRQIEGLSPLTTLLYPTQRGNGGIFGDPYQKTLELEYAPSQAFALRLQYSGGSLFDRRFDVFGANFELALTRRLGIFGRYGYGSYNDTAFKDIEPNYWMAGVSLRNLFVPGAVAGIAAGQPFIESAVGNATQTNFEAFYNFPLSENFGITPLVQVITHPANQADNNTIVTGTLRTVFSF